MNLSISPADIAAAAQRLAGVAHRTPVADFADRQCAAPVRNCSSNARTCNGWGRSSSAAPITRCRSSRRSSARRGVVAFSSGNHAQAIALSARLLGMPATIVMPTDAPQMKIDATRGYGAEVQLYDRYKQTVKRSAASWPRERGMTLIPPFDHPHVMAGQGTAALELIEDVGALDLLFVCVGGGGLISGCAVAARHALRMSRHRRRA